MKIGVDTGFFFLLAQKRTEIEKIFMENEIVTSAVVLYELQKACLKGKLKNCSKLIETLKEATSIAILDEKVAREAAYIAHSTGMPGLDALILASLIGAGCKTIFTTDEHFTLCRKKGIKIVLLK